MEAAGKTFDILWEDEVDSTNSELRRRLDSLDNLSIIAAGCQTAGRGQGTHSWFSTPGLNLTFSVLLKPDIEALELEVISCAVTLGIRDYLLEEGIVSRIKWPNDIWVGDRKICGILVENILEGSIIRKSIVGIGLNVNETLWPADLPNPVSMKELTGTERDPAAELPRLAEKIRRRAAMMRTAGGRSSLQGEFEKNMFRRP